MASFCPGLNILTPAGDRFDPAVPYVKATHWHNGNVSIHPVRPECPKNIKTLINRKQLASYLVKSFKITNSNLVYHQESVRLLKGNSPIWIKTQTSVYTCTQVSVWLDVSLLFVSYLYHISHLCWFFFFKCNPQEARRLKIPRQFCNCSVQLCYFTYGSYQVINRLSKPINLGITRISNWLSANELSFNTNETKLIIFSQLTKVITDSEIPHNDKRVREFMISMFHVW